MKGEIRFKKIATVLAAIAAIITIVIFFTGKSNFSSIVQPIFQKEGFSSPTSSSSSLSSTSANDSSPISSNPISSNPISSNPISCNPISSSPISSSPISSSPNSSNPTQKSGAKNSENNVSDSGNHTTLGSGSNTTTISNDNAKENTWVSINDVEPISVDETSNTVRVRVNVQYYLDNYDAATAILQICSGNDGTWNWDDDAQVYINAGSATTALEFNITIPESWDNFSFLAAIQTIDGDVFDYSGIYLFSCSIRPTCNPTDDTTDDPSTSNERTQNDSWVSINDVNTIAVDEINNTVRVNVNVQYYLDNYDSALIQIGSGNDGSFTIFYGDAQALINAGSDTINFEFDISTPESWDGFSFMAFIYPGPDDYAGPDDIINTSNIYPFAP